jgi:hypothetical protein
MLQDIQQLANPKKVDSDINDMVALIRDHHCGTRRTKGLSDPDQQSDQKRDSQAYRKALNISRHQVIFDLIRKRTRRVIYRSIALAPQAEAIARVRILRCPMEEKKKCKCDEYREEITGRKKKADAKQKKSQSYRKSEDLENRGKRKTRE